MDKQWMKAPRWSAEYDEGLHNFIEFAFATSAQQNRILCPCRDCGNNYWLEAKDVRDHLISIGFMDGYSSWIHHGEDMSSVPSASLPSQLEDDDAEIDPMEQMLMDGFRMYDASALGEEEGFEDEDEDDIDAEAYYKLVCDGSQELYPGCKKFSKLQFLIKLLRMKNRWGASNGYFNELLPLLKDAFPEGEVLPKSFHEARTFVKAIGIGYHCIDACRNDCILFRKEYAMANSCPVCKSSRWKSVKGGVDGRRVHKVAAKVVWHFPLKKRLQRLFMSSKTTHNMRWHSEGRTEDGLLRHPADSPAWKNFDATHRWFSSEVRNVRLGLAADGFNPFGNMNVSYSVWPIILIPYNLPPWVCMKQSNCILSILIPGKKATGKDMDVYMQLVIDDLLELWKPGVMTYDVSCNKKFRLHAALLWTISDWLGRGVLSGESIAACSHCLTDTCSLRLKHGHKNCYMAHRRFLDADHIFRFQARLFDGTQEFREAPVQLSGQEISEMTKDIVTVFGKLQKDPNKKRKRNAEAEEVNENDLSKVFKKRCCFFQLPYWETILVRHNIDVMHTEKNVCGNIVNTLLDVDKKSKNNLNARRDLQEMGIRSDLHPQTEGTTSYIPPALYSLSPKEKDMFCEVLKNARFPAGYASSLHNKVLIKERRLVGLKTHDCHIIMCDLLPLAISKILPDRVSMPLVRLSNYFKKLYSKVICVSEIERLEAEIPKILSQLEKVFPPSFFDIMVHLTVHLATEVRLAGPVHYRNMYPIERCLCKYKSMVTTRSHPEGAIAEGYQFNESMTFCSRYLQTTSNHPCESASHLPYLKIVGLPLSGPSACELSYTTWIQAHRYVLTNYPHITPFLEKHLNELSTNKRKNKRDIERAHHSSFHDWFSDHVQVLISSGNEISDEVRLLAQKPYMMVKKYNSYSVNGYTFHTRGYAEGKATQCDAVALVAKTSSYSSSKDNNPSVGDVVYYGRIIEIIELNYSNIGHVVLFKCDWVDSVQGRGIRKNKLGTTQVNFNNLLNSGNGVFDEPFILATQATQVYYVQDIVDTDWHAVVDATPRDYFDMDARIDDNQDETDSDYIIEPQPLPTESLSNDIPGHHDEDENWIRNDIDGITVDLLSKDGKKRARGEGGKYPCEEPETSKKRRLRKTYNDRLGEANIVPSKMLKVTSGSDDDDCPSKFMDEQRDYERLAFMQNEQGNQYQYSEEDEDDEYQDSEEEDESEDDSRYEDEEEELEADLEHANNFHEINMHEGKKRNVRGPTKMKRMWKEYDPNSKIQLKFNRYGQPCGLKTCKLTSFIGYLVRGKEISLAHKNWSKVDKSHKEKLWTTIKGYFDIDESYKPWVLKSASKKWKDFKVVLKRKYFDPELSRRQNINNGCEERIPPPQWESLVNHWTSNAGQLKSEKLKATRALQLNARHTNGSRSNAVVLDQMELKEGRQVSRAELYIATHTRKNGQPVDDYSFEKIDEIRRRFEQDPSLTTEDTHDNDLFSTLFPKERSGRRTGLGLLAGGVGSARISEALFEVQEVKEENKKLWGVVKTLMSNQTKLEQQYNELKTQVSASQTCPPTETSPRVGTVDGQLLHDWNDDNQGSISHSNRRHGVEPEETRNAMLQSLQKIKREKAEHTLLGNAKEKIPPQGLPETSKKPRRFETPLHKDGREDIKCGMEVGLASPNSKRLVALGTIQKTDRKAKAKDGQPLADYIEVLVSIVYKQTTMLPRAHGKIQNLGSATAHCILWPRQSIICSDPSQLHSKFCSSISQITENTKETPGTKRSTTKSDKAPGKLNNGQVASQNLTKDKTTRRKVCKETPKEPSQTVQGHTSNIHITTSRC